MKLVCVKNKTGDGFFDINESEKLTVGKTYVGQITSGGQYFRCYDDKGKWDVYSLSLFKPKGKK